MNQQVLCCLFGGKSTEYEVSLMSVCSVLQHVNRERFEVVTLGVTKEGKWLYYDGDTEKIRDNTWFEDSAHTAPAMFSPDSGSGMLWIRTPEGGWREKHIDVVFPVMHGANAEDGSMQGLLTLCGIPFVGPGCCASAIAMDKIYTKLILQNFGIPQARFCVVRRGEQTEEWMPRTEPLGGFPLFVKPANAGSSVGSAKARDEEQLRAAVADALRYDSRVLIEQYIAGKEVECAVMGNDAPKASTPGQIDPGSDFYDYETKYITDTSKERIPAPVQPQTAAMIQQYALQIYRVLGCRGLSRVDFFVAGEGERERVVFNEINTLPGFTSISMYPKLFIYDGMPYSQIIDRLVDLACEANGSATV